MSRLGMSRSGPATVALSVGLLFLGMWVPNTSGDPAGRRGATMPPAAAHEASPSDQERRTAADGPAGTGGGLLLTGGAAAAPSCAALRRSPCR